MREPKISELEKLINHFRATNREHEIFEILSVHKGIGPKHPEIAIDPKTHEISREAIVTENLKSNKSIKERAKKFFASIYLAYKEKWYVRYGTYYILLFFIIFTILNAPLILNSMAPSGKTTGPSQIMTYQEVVQREMEKSAPLEPGEIIPVGTSIVIPKIGVNAPIQFVPTREEAVIQERLTTGLVHYHGTAGPGEVGNSFITGHSSNFWWIKGAYNYVFLNLTKMAVGDQAKIYHDGNKYVYQVKEVKVVEPTDTSVLVQTDTPTLTLMTCTPPGTNWKRLIVIFDQISPTYHKPQVVTKEVIANPTSLPSTDDNSAGGVILSIWNFIKSIFSD